MASSSTGAFAKFLRLDRAEKALLAEAAVSLTCATLALAFLPFRRAVQLGCVPLGGGRARPATAEECAWAIEAASRRMPWRLVCIHKGIAAQRMLRRRSIDARLHYGVGHDRTAGKLNAHVWVSVAGEPIIGGQEAARVAEVAVFP